MHQVVLDGISDNMDSLIQSVNYGIINTDDKTTNGFYVIKLISEAYMLQNKTKVDGQTIYDSELFVNAQYICSMLENSNWHWKQHLLQQTIMVPTRTSLHMCLDVVMVTDVQDIPENFCNMIQAKTAIQKHTICLTDTDYDYILD